VAGDVARGATEGVEEDGWFASEASVTRPSEAQVRIGVEAGRGVTGGSGVDGRAWLADVAVVTGDVGVDAGEVGAGSGVGDAGEAGAGPVRLRPHAWQLV
jgi:hypothetical protein